MNFILVSEKPCTFKDWDGAIENCKTYDTYYKGYTPSSGVWSISSGSITAIDTENYSFDGWFTIQDRSYGTVQTANTLITKNRSISLAQINSAGTYGNSGLRFVCAKYIGKELICTYIPNGGFCDRYFDRVRVEGAFPALPTATWDSETTSRWYTLPTGGTEIHEGDTVTQTEDFSLYAHWSRTETCTVTFNAGEGTASEAFIVYSVSGANPVCSNSYVEYVPLGSI